MIIALILYLMALGAGWLFIAVAGKLNDDIERDEQEQLRRQGIR